MARNSESVSDATSSPMSRNVQLDHIQSNSHDRSSNMLEQPMGPIEPKQGFNDYVGAFQLNPINEVEEPGI